MGGSKEERVRLFLVGLSDRMGGNGQKNETYGIPLEHQEMFFTCETQRGFGFSILGDIKKLSEHSPGQLALSDCLNRVGLDQKTS